jgi:hypothetical protein
MLKRTFAGLAVLCLGAVLIDASPAAAQGGRSGPGPGLRASAPGPDRPSPERVLAVWTRALRLSDAQVATIRPLLEQMFRDARAVVRDRSIPMGEKPERIQTIRQSAMATIRSQLSAEQAIKFDEMQKRLEAGRTGSRTTSRSR